MVTIEELQAKITREKKKLKRIKSGEARKEFKKGLQKELIRLQKGTKKESTFKKLIKRGAKGIVKLGKEAAPVIKKQVKLIQDQQRRDRAIEKLQREKMRKNKRKSKPQKHQGFTLFKPLNF